MQLMGLQLSEEFHTSPSFLLEIQTAVNRLIELGATERALALLAATCLNMGTALKARPDLKPPLLDPDKTSLLAYSRQVADWILTHGGTTKELYALVTEHRLIEKLARRIDPTLAEVEGEIKNS